MKLSRFINILAVASMMLAALGFSYSPVGARGESAQFDRDTLYVPGELIVRYRNTFTRSAAFAAASSLADSLGGTVAKTSGTASLLSFDEGADIEALAATISSEPGVVSVEPNYLRWIPESQPMGDEHKLTSVVRNAEDGRRREVSLDELAAMRSKRRVNGRVQAVPTYPVEGPTDQNWGFWWANASMIWNNPTVSPGVCVIDTGVDIAHPDLAGKAVNGFDFVNDDPIPQDDHGHGTHVSGTIAAKINNGIGFSGISNGKVVGVKVLSAQGWGTAWDIGKGIEYCGNRVDVKVINMSLGGGGASSWEFDRLNYAINTKGKLVVAAAGNASSSYFSFPAAWAAPYVCKDGSHTFPADCTIGGIANTIHNGLVSVAAAQAYWTDWYDGYNGGAVDGYLWVDTNGNGNEDVTNDANPLFWNEHFYMDQCAAPFSNYGDWVEVIAPGVDIFSTVPVSYPFHEQYFWGADGDDDGYDWWGGTSMASPQVAGAAARAWSVYPGKTNLQIEDDLLAIGSTWHGFGMDPNMSNPAVGYDDTGFNGEAPYCWPDGTNGSFYSMTGTKYLNVAALMNRGAITVALADAVSGVPLKGATVRAYFGASVKDTSVMLSDWSRWTDLINLPAGVAYTVKANKAGYTAGDQFIAWQGVAAGYYNWGPWLDAAIPPSNRIAAVGNWENGTDFEMFMWTANFSGPGFVVGPWDPGPTAAIYIDQGDLLTIPFARWNRDGGFYDWMGMESITITPKPGVAPPRPYYNATAFDYYDIYLSDYWVRGALNSDYMIMRIWAGGKNIGVAERLATAAGGWSPNCDTNGADNVLGNSDDEIWWYAGFINGATFTAIDDCGEGAPFGVDPNGVWPYVSGRTTSGIPERVAPTR